MKSVVEKVPYYQWKTENKNFKKTLDLYMV